jgi:BRCT domain type II-containing protein
MRNIVTIALAAGLLAAALPAQAAVSTTNNSMRSDARAQNQTGRSSDADRQICVREQRTESRVIHPICHTAREWRDIDGEVPGEH